MPFHFASPRTREFRWPRYFRKPATAVVTAAPAAQQHQPPRTNTLHRPPSLPIGISGTPATSTTATAAASSPSPCSEYMVLIKYVTAVLHFPGLSVDDIADILMRADQQRLFIRSALMNAGHQDSSTPAALLVLADKLEQYYGSIRAMQAIAAKNHDKVDAAAKFEWRGRKAHSPTVSTTVSATEPSPVASSSSPSPRTPQQPTFHFAGASASVSGSPNVGVFQRPLSTLAMFEKMESGGINVERLFVLAAWANIHCCIAHLAVPAPLVIKPDEVGRASTVTYDQIKNAIDHLGTAHGILTELRDLISKQPEPLAWRSAGMLLSAGFVRAWIGAVCADIRQLQVQALVVEPNPKPNQALRVLCGMLAAAGDYSTCVKDIRALAASNSGCVNEPVYQAILNHCEQAAALTRANAMMFRLLLPSASSSRSVSQTQQSTLPQLSAGQKIILVQTAMSLTEKYAKQSAAAPTAAATASCTEFTPALQTLHILFTKQRDSLRTFIRSVDFTVPVPPSITGLLPDTQTPPSKLRPVYPGVLYDDWTKDYFDGYRKKRPDTAALASSSSHVAAPSAAAPAAASQSRRRTRQQSNPAPSGNELLPPVASTPSSTALRRSSSGRSTSSSRSRTCRRGSTSSSGVSSASTPAHDVQSVMPSLSALSLADVSQSDSSESQTRSSVSATF